MGCVIVGCDDVPKIYGHLRELDHRGANLVGLLLVERLDIAYKRVVVSEALIWRELVVLPDQLGAGRRQYAIRDLYQSKLDRYSDHDAKGTLRTGVACSEDSRRLRKSVSWGS